jgi:acyl dehydratase
MAAVMKQPSPAPPFVSHPIGRVDIAWICVATDDPSQLHLDEPYAVGLGHRSVVVPGTMMVGWLGQYFEEWAGGQDKLRQWRVRFVAPVWPGDQLTFTGQVSGDEIVGGERRCNGEVVVTAPDGRVVAKAWGAFAADAQELQR